jgi:hypothetical protein
MSITDRYYRDCDGLEILRQLGTTARMSIGFREMMDLGHGISGKIGIGNPPYFLRIRLSADDTYQVEILRRAKDGNLILENETMGVYCEELAGIVLDNWGEVMEKN